MGVCFLEYWFAVRLALSLLEFLIEPRRAPMACMAAMPKVFWVKKDTSTFKILCCTVALCGRLSYTIHELTIPRGEQCRAVFVVENR